MYNVLLVDDDSIVLKLCAHILSDIDNLSVMQASHGTGALTIAGKTPRIDLLLSDIVMQSPPDGIQLAETLTACRPEMRVLLMSGTRQMDSISRRGWHFIAKPFLPSALLSKIEETLQHPLYQKIGARHHAW